MQQVESNVEQFLFSHSGPIFDVRSPGEFLHGAIPTSLSLPLFSDEERHEVGICYKQKGKKEAIALGLGYVGPKLGTFAPLFLKEETVRILCFRGGMRSASMAWLAALQGCRVIRLEKGYKSYRQWVLQQLETSFPAIVFSGPTGSGKTELLRLLQEKGEPVLDLEGLACHRGSVFGGFEAYDQPTQENFENRVAHALYPLLKKPYIYVEAESRAIGKVTLSTGLYNAIHSSRCLFVECPFEERLQRVVDDYGTKPQEVLLSNVFKLEKRLGGKRTAEIAAFLTSGNIVDAAALLLEYYDTTYEHCLKKHSGTRYVISRKEIVDAISQGTFQELTQAIFESRDKPLACQS
jgi:tRNA 2-selenouridine synthase